MYDFDEEASITLGAYQEIAGSYANTHTIAQAPTFWRECMKRFADLIRTSPMYQNNAQLPVLDIGCGPGRDSILLAQMDFNVLAVDISDAMLEEARKRCAHQPHADRITFRRMDMHHLELANDSCAGVWASASFLHIPKRENLSVLREIVRVLVPGSPLTLLVKEVDGGPDERYEPHKESDKSRFFARYRGSELWELLEQANMTVQEILTSVDDRFPDRPRWLGALAIKSSS